MHLLLVDAEHEFFARVILLLDEIAPRRFVLEWASTYGFAVSLLRRHRFDLCLINECIGHRSGTDLLLAMRVQGYTTPVLLLTSGEEMPDPRGGRVMDQIDRSRLSAEALRRALREAGLRPAALAPFPPPQATIVASAAVHA